VTDGLHDRAWRLLVTEPADGATNMAIDEALWLERRAGAAPLSFDPLVFATDLDSRGLRAKRVLRGPSTGAASAR